MNTIEAIKQLRANAELQTQALNKVIEASEHMAIIITDLQEKVEALSKSKDDN